MSSRWPPPPTSRHYAWVTASTELLEAWDAADRRFGSMGFPAATLIRDFLTQLRPRWEARVRPDTSMATLLFTRPGETGHRFSERVEVAVEAEDRARMAFVRDIPRAGLDKVGGRQTVAGDFTRPENMTPAVEALLRQLATPSE